MKLVVPKEILPGEKRVALVPDSVRKIKTFGWDVVVQSGAGEPAFYPDQDYEAAGATIVTGAEEAYRDADVIVKVRKPAISANNKEAEMFPQDALLMGLLSVLQNPQDKPMSALRASRIIVSSRWFSF